VRALFEDAPVVHHDDFVRFGDGREAVGDDERGAAFEQPLESQWICDTMMTKPYRSLKEFPMSTLLATQTLDAQLRLDLMLMQLRRLEQEILMLRKALPQTQTSAAPPRTFASLYGVWAGVVIDEEDFQAARLTLPEDLP